MFLWSGAAILFLIAAAVAASNLYVLRCARDHLVSGDELREPRQTAIVLGARVYADGSMAAVTHDRVTTAVALYQRGLVRKLLLSGDHGRATYDEVNTMRRAAQAIGVRPEDIFLDHAGFSTYDTMVRARQVFQVQSAVVVTQTFHLPRAVFFARKAGIQAIGISADRRTYATHRRMSRREVLARLKAVLLVVVRARPRFLGPAIPITGDGRASWDQLNETSDRGHSAS